MNDNSTLKSILLMAANPKGSVGLQLQKEEREIKERLRLAGYGKTPINSTGATRPRDIQQAMLDFKPQIVHFSGHGAGQEGLVFEDITGQDKLVSSAALANLFRLFSSRLECVVLNACYSKFQAEAIARHIEHVIGMSQEIGDNAAIEFAVGFYSSLGARESIEFSYELGCSAIQLEGFSDDLTPVLYKKGKILQIYIGNRILRNDEIDQDIERSDLGADVSTALPINRSFETPVETSLKTPSQPTHTHVETQKLSSKDTTVSNLIDKLFDALSSVNNEIAIQKFEAIAHQSLFRNGQIDPSFRKNCFNIAFTRINLYKRPIEIIGKEPTGRTRLGLRGDKEEGIEEKYKIARKDYSGGFDGHVRFFFPDSGKPVKISGLNF